MKPLFYMTLTIALFFTSCKRRNTPLPNEFKGLAGKWKLMAIYKDHYITDDFINWRAVVEDKYVEFNMDGSMKDERYNAFRIGDYYSDGYLVEDSVIFTYRNDGFQSDTTRYTYTLTPDELVLYPIQFGSSGEVGMKYFRVSSK